MVADMAETPRNQRRILGGAVRRFRDDLRHLTQDELATAVAAYLPSGKPLHHAYISNIESGRKQPSEAVIGAIANVLKVDIDDISYMANVYVIVASNEDAA